jgi:hypothetical protein
MPLSVYSAKICPSIAQCHLVKDDMNANFAKITPGIHLIGFIFTTIFILINFMYYKKTDLHLPKFEVLYFHRIMLLHDI